MEKVSALMDGELGDGEAKGQIARLKIDTELKYGWESYHLIGDALRGEATLSAGFSRRLEERLAQEPTVLAPQRLPATRKFYTYAVSAAASAAGLALVAWVTMSTGSAPIATPNPEMAKAPATPAVTPPATATALAPNTAPAEASTALAAVQPDPGVPSEGQSNAYLLAHQGISPSTAIQGLAPYIRTVSNISQAAPAPR